MTNSPTLIDTFENWPVTFLKKQDLADNGFMYVGENDYVKCVHCGIMLGMWEEGDDPYSEHKRNNPKCPFINSSELETDTCGIRDVSELEPNYSSYNNRLASFKTCGNVFKQNLEELADAGFYFYGPVDKVKCFNCDIGLHEWKDTDDPWEEHALWSPQCEYLRRRKDSSFINNVLENNFGKKTTKENLHTETPSKFDDNISLLCGICLTAERSILYQPCGHLYACKKCDSKIETCPICRGEIKTRIKAHLS